MTHEDTVEELSAALGLKRASELEPPKVRQRRSEHLRQAERKAGHVAVYILGPLHAIPRSFGDNQGMWPVLLGTTSNPRDLESRVRPLHWSEVRILALLWTKGEGWAKRLKAATEAAIAARGDRIRGSWHDLEPALAQMTFELVAREHKIEVFTEEERWRRLEADVERAVKAFRVKRGH